MSSWSSTTFQANLVMVRLTLLVVCVCVCVCSCVTLVCCSYIPKRIELVLVRGLLQRTAILGDISWRWGVGPVGLRKFSALVTSWSAISAVAELLSTILPLLIDNNK